jgi:aminoglycoside 6'-N-acetyltransferase I
MAIRDLDVDDSALREQLALIAWEAGALAAPQWLPTLDDAREEVDDAAAKGQVATRGAAVLVLSTADATQATSLSGADIYADPIAALGSLTYRKEHPARFWQRIGYSLVGVVPDAEGPGIPSIMLARRPRTA